MKLLPIQYIYIYPKEEHQTNQKNSIKKIQQTNKLYPKTHKISIRKKEKIITS
jgi:hypothetical protein